MAETVIPSARAEAGGLFARPSDTAWFPAGGSDLVTRGRFL